MDATVVGTTLEHVCDQFPFCATEATRYRNIDGKCNNPNPQRGGWGAAGSPMYVNVIIECHFQKDKLTFPSNMMAYIIHSGNDCYHPAMRMAFGVHGKIIQSKLIDE